MVIFKKSAKQVRRNFITALKNFKKDVDEGLVYMLY